MGRIEIDPKTKEPVFVAKWYGTDYNQEIEKNRFSWEYFVKWIGILILINLAIYGLLRLLLG